MRASPLLVIEDDDDLRGALSDVLGREGFRVVALDSVEAAFDYLRDSGEVPCLLLVDLLLPGQTGWEFLQELRDRPRFEATPIVVMSGLQDPYLPQGASLLPKPIDLASLLAAVRDHCAGAG